ncbi:MAG: hypothetical protein ABEK50_02815 [bacterium]
MTEFSPRLLLHPPLRGSLNMAVDTWLVTHSNRPVLRFYEWKHPTLTVGYRQQYQPPDELKSLLGTYSSALRPTGGGYLLHAGTLTYSIVFPEEHPGSERSIMEMYSIIRDQFQTVLETMGVDLPEDRGETSQTTPDCLKHPGRHEPVVEGRKWMAAAQVCTETGVLQHGSLYVDSPEEVEFPGERPFYLSRQGYPVDRSRVISEFIRRMDENCFSNTFNYEPLREEEWEQISDMESHFMCENIENLPSFRLSDFR